MWSADGPQGHESAKVRFDLVPYMRGRILDLGCGPDKVFPIAIGIDNRIDAKLFGIECKPDIPVDTCARMPFLADESADTVVSSHLLEHFPYEDVPEVLRDWLRITKTGGYLILYVPNNQDSVANGGYPRVGEPGANQDHKWDVGYGKVISAMEKAGSWDLVEFEKRDKEHEYSLLFIFRKMADGHAFSYKQPKPVRKTLGIVRLGAYGDALWITGLLPYWKEQGYHITVYTQPQGEEALRHDPHIDRIICQPHGLFDFSDGRIGAWQTAYWLHEEKKYDRFINLIGSTERRLLPQHYDPDFYLPAEQRRRVMNRNYVEALCEWADVPFDQVRPQRFTPTSEEMAWAAEERAKIAGPVVIINPAGSSVPKWWPYAQQLADMLSAEGIHSRIVGDLRWQKFRESRFAKVIGTTWPIRKAFTFAAMADVVLGTESAIVNSVAFEAPLKIVTLSHSTHENLTRDWHNTIAVEPAGLDCYPCHRIHTDMTHCTHIKQVNAAACQAAASPELLFEHITKYLQAVQKEQAA